MAMKPYFIRQDNEPRKQYFIRQSELPVTAAMPVTGASVERSAPPARDMRTPAQKKVDQERARQEKRERRAEPVSRIDVEVPRREQAKYTPRRNLVGKGYFEALREDMYVFDSVRRDAENYDSLKEGLAALDEIDAYEQDQRTPLKDIGTFLSQPAQTLMHGVNAVNESRGIEVPQVKNKVTFSRAVDSRAQQAKESYDGKALVDNRAETYGKYGYHRLYSYMTDDEVLHYSKLLDTEGAETADRWLDTLMPTLSARELNPVSEKAASSTGNAIAQSVGSVGNKFFGAPRAFADDMWEYVTTGEIDPYSKGNQMNNIANTQRTGAADRIDSDVGQMIYHGGMNLVDVGVNLLAAGGIGTAFGGTTAAGSAAASSLTGSTSAATNITKGVSMSLSFSNAAQSGFAEAKSRGLDDTRALALGLARGGIEMATEKFSLDQLLSNPHGVFQFLSSNVVTEGAEEGAAGIFNIIADVIVAQDQSEWAKDMRMLRETNPALSEADTFWQVFQKNFANVNSDILGGMIGGLVFSTAKVAPYAINRAKAWNAERRANKAADIVNTAAAEVFAPKEQAKKTTLNTAFRSELRKWFDTTTEENRGKSGKRFLVGTTSDVLKQIGVKDYNIYFGASKIHKILSGNKSMSVNTIADAVTLLENPMIIMKSKTVEDSIVMFGEVYTDTDAKKPVMISVLLNPKTKSGEILDYAVITSAYGRRKSNVQGLIDTSEILYINEQKDRTDQWLKALGLQLPSALTTYGSIGSIPQTPPSVNTNSSTDSPSFTDAVFADKAETAPADDVPEFVKNVWDTSSEDVSPAPPTADDGRRERFNEEFEQRQGMDMDAIDTEDGATRREHADRYEATLPDDVDALADVVEDLQKKAEQAHREYGNGSQTLPINIQLFAARRKLAWAMLQQADIFDGDSETNFTKKYKRQIKYLKKANIPLDVLKNVLENGGVRYDHKSDTQLQAQVTELLGEDTGNTTDREMELYNRVVGDFVDTLNDVETAAATELVNRLYARGDHDHATSLHLATKRHGTEIARAFRQQNNHIEYDSPASGSIFLQDAMDTSLDEELEQDGKRRGSERFYDVALELQRAVKANAGADPAVTMRGLLSKLANKDDIGEGRANATIARKIRKALKAGDAPLVALHQKMMQAEKGNLVATRDALAEYLSLTFADAETRQKVDALFADMRAIEGDDLAADKARHAKLEEAFKVAAKRLPVTFEERWNDYRRTAMLSAPKTHIKNFLSNAINMPQRKIDEAMSWVLEQWFFRASKGRTQYKTQSLGWSFTEHGKKIRQMVEDDTERMMLDLKDVEKYMNNSDNNTLKRYRDLWADSGAVGKVIGGSSKAVKLLLEKGDATFTRSAYRDALGQIMTARGATEITDEMRDLARQRALVATFKAENAISDKILNLRNNSNAVGRVAIDTIAPFVTTPANIMAEGYRHSFINVVHGAVGVHQAIQQGKSAIEVAQAINSLSKGITGTVESGILAGIGLLLAKLGVVKLVGTGTGKGTDDKSAEELSGEREYALQVGNYSISLDWMQPAVFPFIYGAAALNAITNTNRSDEEDDRWWNEALNWADLAFDGITAGYGSLLDMSMLQGVVNLLRSNSGDKSDIAKNIGMTLVTSYPSQFMPAILTNFIRATDNKKRSYTDATLTQKALAKVGITHFLPEEKDIWGDTVWKNAAEDNVLGAWLLNAFSPSNIVKGNAANDKSGISNELLDLYYGGEKGIAGKAIPSGVNSTWIFADSNTPVLESKQRDEIENALGNAYRTAAEEFMRGDHAVKVSDDRQVTWKNASEEDKLTALGKVFSRAADQVKAQYGIVTTEGSDPKSWGIDGVDEETYKQFLHDTQDYIATDGASADDQKWNYIHNMQADDQTKANLWGEVNLQSDDREKYEGWGLSSDQYNWFNFFSDKIKEDYETEKKAADGNKNAENKAKQKKKQSVFELIDKMDLTAEQKWQMYNIFYDSADKSAPWYSSKDRNADWWGDIWKEK